jgi:anaerobic selenocysteine-containing dehydrogenase
VLAYVKDGKAVEIEGDPEHPTNQGNFDGAHGHKKL